MCNTKLQTDGLYITPNLLWAQAKGGGPQKRKKEKFTLFSDHDGSLLRRQPGAMTIGHSPKGKENPKPKVDLAWFVCFCLTSPFLVLS